MIQYRCDILDLVQLRRLLCRNDDDQRQRPIKRVLDDADKDEDSEPPVKKAKIGESHFVRVCVRA